MRNTFLKEGSVIQIGDKFLVGFGKRSYHNSYNKNFNVSFYFPDYFLTTQHPWFTHEYSLIVSRQELLDLIAPYLPSGSPALHWQNRQKEIFVETFAELQALFAAGSLKKAVPFVFTKAEALMTQSLLVWSIWNLLKQTEGQKLFVYGCWDEHSGSGILGGTPESLFHLTKGHLSTMACAGTQLATLPPEKLLEDFKERAEHQWVVDGIRESLELFSEVNVGDLEVRPFKSLSHLVTPITVKLQESAEFADIVTALHPTPALGAYPRKEGLCWLAEYQKKIDRKRFGAPVGYVLPDGSSGCLVGIRNVQWDQDGMAIGAGCGVVQSSRGDMEWNEIETKIKAIRTLLCL